MKTVCFTGYRPEKLDFTENDEKYRALVGNLKIVVRRLFTLGYTNYISGMARGFDMWAAEAVCTLKKENDSVKLSCAIPFPSQAKSWTDEEKTRYNDILDFSDEKIVISPTYTRDSFHKRNRYMVDNSDVVVCLYDGTSGGTAYTVNYALKKGKVVIQIHAKTLAVTVISENKLQLD